MAGGGSFSVDWTAVFTLVIAVATIFYVYFSYRLWEATNESVQALKASLDVAKTSTDVAKESLNLSRQIFEATTRPFLVSSEPRFNKSGAFLFFFGVTVRNEGNGPAYRVTQAVTLFLDQKPVQDTGSPKSVALVPPHSDFPYDLTVRGSDAEVVWNNSKLFEAEARAEYSSGAGQRYSKADHWQWNAEAGAFDLIESTEGVIGISAELQTGSSQQLEPASKPD